MPTGDSALQIIVYTVISVLCAYGVGRIHEWYKHSMDRDRSFREGYNHGYHTLFPFATRGTCACERSDQPARSARSGRTGR